MLFQSIHSGVIESDAAKVQESAEKWTGALLQLLNTPPQDQTGANKASEDPKSGVEISKTAEDTHERPVYTKEDVVAMLSKLTGSGDRNMEDCLGVLAQMDVHDNFEESE